MFCDLRAGYMGVFIVQKLIDLYLFVHFSVCVLCFNKKFINGGEIKIFGSTVFRKYIRTKLLLVDTEKFISQAVIISLF